MQYPIYGEYLSKPPPKEGYINIDPLLFADPPQKIGHQPLLVHKLYLDKVGPIAPKVAMPRSILLALAGQHTFIPAFHFLSLNTKHTKEGCSGGGLRLIVFYDSIALSLVLCSIIA